MDMIYKDDCVISVFSVEADISVCELRQHSQNHIET